VISKVQRKVRRDGRERKKEGKAEFLCSSRLGYYPDCPSRAGRGQKEERQGKGEGKKYNDTHLWFKRAKRATSGKKKKPSGEGRGGKEKGKEEKGLEAQLVILIYPWSRAEQGRVEEEEFKRKGRRGEREKREGKEGVRFFVSYALVSLNGSEEKGPKGRKGRKREKGKNKKRGI